MTYEESPNYLIITDSLDTKRVVCPIHGDIGSWGGLVGASTITFSFDREDMFCAKCIRDLLLAHIKPCEMKGG